MVHASENASHHKTMTKDHTKENLLRCLLFFFKNTTYPTGDSLSLYRYFICNILTFMHSRFVRNITFQVIDLRFELVDLLLRSQSLLLSRLQLDIISRLLIDKITPGNRKQKIVVYSIKKNCFSAICYGFLIIFHVSLM